MASLDQQKGYVAPSLCVEWLRSHDYNNPISAPPVSECVLTDGSWISRTRHSKEPGGSYLVLYNFILDVTQHHLKSGLIKREKIINTHLFMQEI
jgi:hypothetical protein